MNPSYKLFLDLDGVLADFDQGVYQITQKYPHQMTVGELWKAVSRAEHFFDTLPWMEGGKRLWYATQACSPIILTGLPHGNWAEPQKRIWCTRELGADVPVITCMARDKITLACKQLKSKEIPVLVDDRPKYRALWEERGGIFIHHKTVGESLEALKHLDFPIDESV